MEQEASKDVKEAKGVLEGSQRAEELQRKSIEDEPKEEHFLLKKIMPMHIKSDDFHTLKSNGFAPKSTGSIFFTIRPNEKTT